MLHKTKRALVIYKGSYNLWVARLYDRSIILKFGMQLLHCHTESRSHFETIQKLLNFDLWTKSVHAIQFQLIEAWWHHMASRNFVISDTSNDMHDYIGEILVHCQSHHWIQSQWTLNKSLTIFIPQNTFEKVLWKYRPFKSGLNICRWLSARLQ